MTSQVAALMLLSLGVASIFGMLVCVGFFLAGRFKGRSYMRTMVLLAAVSLLSLQAHSVVRP